MSVYVLTRVPFHPLKVCLTETDTPGAVDTRAMRAAAMRAVETVAKGGMAAQERRVVRGRVVAKVATLAVSKVGIATMVGAIGITTVGVVTVADTIPATPALVPPTTSGTEDTSRGPPVATTSLL